MNNLYNSLNNIDKNLHSNEIIYDIAIIGGGPVGIFSIFAFGMQLLNCVLIDAFQELGGQCACVYPEKYIYDIPGFPKIKSRQLIDNLVEQAMVFDPTILLQSVVENIETFDDYFLLSIKNSSNEIRQVKAKAITLALGAGIFKPVKLAIEHSEELEDKQIFYFINELTKFKDKDIAIIGAGDSAIDWAVDLSEHARNVYLIHRREYIKAHPASWQQALNNPKIKIKIPYMLEKLELENDTLKKLHIQNVEDSSTEILDIDYILPCIGLKSDISFLNELGLEVAQNRIMVDPTTMRTSKNGIYAIGDCVYYNNKRKLILTGFAESASCAIDVFKYIYPDRALQQGHSTTIGLPK